MVTLYVILGHENIHRRTQPWDVLLLALEAPGVSSFNYCDFLIVTYKNSNFDNHNVWSADYGKPFFNFLTKIVFSSWCHTNNLGQTAWSAIDVGKYPLLKGFRHDSKGEFMSTYLFRSLKSHFTNSNLCVISFSMSHLRLHVVNVWLNFCFYS